MGSEGWRGDARCVLDGQDGDGGMYVGCWWGGGIEGFDGDPASEICQSFARFMIFGVRYVRMSGCQVLPGPVRYMQIRPAALSPCRLAVRKSSRLAH